VTGELGEVIGQGRTAGVYARGQDQVVKLFFAGRERSSVDEEVAARERAREMMERLKDRKGEAGG
jgi:hypothetical protein